MIEVEIRAIVDDKKYKEMVGIFKDKLKTEKQITYYFKCNSDFRMMKTLEFTQLWLKSGEINDEIRNEKVVKLNNKYRNDMEGILQDLKYDVEIKWFRTRNKCKLNENVEMCIDKTEGYANIVEIEKLVENNDDVEGAMNELQELFDSYGLVKYDKSMFKEKYEDYKLNWKKYTQDINEEVFLK